MEIELKIKNELYHNNGYGIYSCEPNKEDRNKVELHPVFRNITIKGNVPKLIKDEMYKFELGPIEKTMKGNSYPILSFKMEEDVSAKSQYLFLKSILTKNQYQNICLQFPQTEDFKIVDKIKNDEIDLKNVKGIGESVVLVIKKKILEKEEMIKLINKLSPIGVSDSTIMAIMKHYGDVNLALEKIDDSFYNLCEVKGLGFIKVDGYAQKNGENKYSLKRIEAALNYHVHEFASQGHSWTSEKDMIKELIKSLKLNENDTKEKLEEFKEKNKKNYNSNLVFVDNCVTSKYYLMQEKNILENLKRIQKNFIQKVDTNDLDKLIKLAELKINIIYTEEQREVIKSTMENGVALINGKGGTGKSQIIKAITTICEENELTYQAMALSGRAAQLLTLKGIEAGTIHRTLGYTHEGFMFNQHFPMPYDVVILEEASMVNAELWDCITQAVQNGSQFIIVGDSGQLSGIGNGDVLRDLNTTDIFVRKELNQIHRQAQGSGIIQIASLIREGHVFLDYIQKDSISYEDKQIFENYGENEDLAIITYNDKEEVEQMSSQIIEQRFNFIKNNPTETNFMDFQILTATKDMCQEINNYCQEIRDLPKKIKVSNSKYDFLIGDKVIVSGNKYKIKAYASEIDFMYGNAIKEHMKEIDDYVDKEFSLFNGTMGTVKGLKDVKGEEAVLVNFEGIPGYIAIDKESLPSLDLAYCITIHRSQGMTIPNVLVILDYSGFKLLSRQLTYTAITRASKKCVLVAQHNALYFGIKNDASGTRRTFLEQFLELEKKA